MNTNNKVNKGDFKYYTSKSRPSLTIRLFVPKTETGTVAETEANGMARIVKEAVIHNQK